MPFWPVVLVVLLGIPAFLLFSGMGMIFAAGGYASGGSMKSANRVVYGWLAIAWVLAAAFGAFGLVPAWRAWHDGVEDFAGGLRTFGWWLVGVGGVASVGWTVYRAVMKTRPEDLQRSPLVAVLRWLLLSVGALPWAALGAWLLWPLVQWPLRGRFAWPDAATGWTRTAWIEALLVAGVVIPDVARRLRKR